MRFLHIGDVHIGRSRLDGRLPSSDFSRAFDQAVDAALAEKVSFVVIAGDFFDRARIEPNHLSEAEPGLRRLKDANIPVVAIEGNHDVVSSYDPRPSWLSYLNHSGLIRLLRTTFKDGAPVMKEWTERDREGNWLDLDGARLYGAGWFGASTARRIELLAPHLERKGFTLLLLHAGIVGQGDFGMLEADKLAPLRNRVDYLALGHIHKAYSLDGWAFNAGAMENWDLSEADYGDDKGYLLVTVTDGKPHAFLHPVKRRPILRTNVNCTGCTAVEDVLAHVRKAASSWVVDPTGVIQANLWGMLEFDAGSVDARTMARAIEQSIPCAAADVLLRFGTKPGETEEPPEALRDEIEREEIEKLILERGKYEGNVDAVRGMLGALLSARGDEELFLELLQHAKPMIEKTHETAPAPAAKR